MIFSICFLKHLTHFIFLFFPTLLLFGLLATLCNAYYNLMLGHHGARTHALFHAASVPVIVTMPWKENNNEQINKNGLKFHLILGDFHMSAAPINPMFRHGCK